MKQAKVTIIIDEELKKPVAGLYKMQFSNGYYYIGCSKNIDQRIQQHLIIINSGFSCKCMPTPLRKMKGFKGTITFSLVLCAYKMEFSKFGVCQKLVELETEYIRSNNTDKKMLNLIVGGRKNTANYGQPYHWIKTYKQ